MANVRQNIAFIQRDGDDEDDFEDATVELTQPSLSAAQCDNSLTQLEPTQVAIEAAVETVRCLVCSLNLSAKTIMERELHLNACLDATTLDSRYDCPTCGKELTDYNEQRRMAHVNMCLDRVAHNTPVHTSPQAELPIPPTTTTENESTELYMCRICSQRLPLATVEARSRHVKQCGQRFGLRSADMRSLATSDERPDSIDGGSSVTSEHQDDELRNSNEQDATDHGSSRGQQPHENHANAFTIMMSSSTASGQRNRAMNQPGGSSSSSFSSSSNAFDILMKSSKTESVIAATSSSSSARSFWHTSATARTYKRPRTTPPSSGGSSATVSSGFNSSRRYSCPDFKRILGTHPPFIVDGFRYASKSLSNVYFLTHFHSDHYTGLQKSFDCGVIYCNQVTAALVVQELGIDPKYVHPVPMYAAVDVRGVQVTFMDANHCPGATIILFRLRSGATYLHTGDFRFYPKMWDYAPLRSFLPAQCATTNGEASASHTRIDGIYLDTTYADPKYTFPTQEASIQHALTLVDKHLNGGEKVLFLFGSYSVGKERLFMEVATRYQRKVCISRAKLKMIQTYGWPGSQMKLLTTEPAATNIHVVPMQELRLDHLGALLQKHRLRFHQIVAFRPTGWTFSRASASLSTCRSDPSGSVRIYGIPYSEHSSFAELCEFIRVMNPQTIIPTVNCDSDRSVKKQIDLIRQSAFRSISSIFLPQQSEASPEPRDP